jgi:ATP-dependent exoDNAse (exonuclease V) beta subunit
MNERAVPSFEDLQARASSLDPSRSFIVQAPAGSGKTELLTQRYLRLLVTVEHPEQVLAITFTRKAAAEMRARISEALQKASVAGRPEAAHAQTTYDLARAVCELDEKRAWKLREYPARLRIQTIDALTGMLARRMPILSGAGAPLEPLDDARPLYRQAVEELLEHLGENSAAARGLETLITHLGNQVDRLLALLTDLLQRRDQWLHALMHARGASDLRAVIEHALNDVVVKHFESLVANLSPAQLDEMWALTQYAAENLLANPKLAAGRRPLLESALSLILPGASAEDADAWRAVADVFLTRDGRLLRSVTATQGFPLTDPAMKARMEQLLAQLRQQPAFCSRLNGVRTLPGLSYNPEQWLILEALFNVLPLAVAQLQIVFEQQRKADYVETSLRALRALGTPEEPTDLALALDYRVQHILVDEFQDTSFTQLDLLERLTAGWTQGDGRTLFCVGDPMQSIYRFRQAEVGLFLQLQQRGLKHLPLQPLRLTANFRSHQPIVAWINQIFPAVFPGQDDIEQGAVKFSPSEAARREMDGDVHVHPGIDASQLQVADLTVQLVRDALARDADGTIAILVSGRNHLGFIGSRLHAAGIEHQAVEIEMLAQRPVVQDLIALTRALVHLGDRTAWLAILRAPWSGLQLADIHAVASGDAKHTIRALIERALQSEQQSDGAPLSSDGRQRLQRLYEALEKSLAQRGRAALRDWVERTWISLGGPATLTSAQDLEDARAYLRRLDELDEAGDLSDVTRLEEQLEGLCARPRPDSATRVEIMTIHKAKGLEFDTVILPGLERCVSGDDQPLLYWTRVPGLEEGLVFAPLTAAGADVDPIYRWAELLERGRTEQERARLLYVAATRAKRDLHLLGTVETRIKDGNTELRAPRRGSMLALLWEAVSARYDEALQAHQDAAPLTLASSESSSVPLRRLPLDWRLPELEHGSPAGTMQSIDLIDTARPLFDWVTETSRRVGTLVHRELERLVAREGRASTTIDTPGVRARMLAELAELGVPAERCVEAVERVLLAVRSALADARGRWLLGLETPLREAESEFALSGLVNGQVVQGVIDRTFLDERGVRWIVDFKTSTHEGAGLEEFITREVERYAPQLKRYATLMGAFKPAQPIKAALYFPLLKQWREVGLG